jgi:hypothetical protein
MDSDTGYPYPFTAISRQVFPANYHRGIQPPKAQLRLRNQ